MEILTSAELQARLKTSERKIIELRKQGMPVFFLPIARATKGGGKEAPRFIFEDVLDWLKSRSGYSYQPSTTTKPTDE